MNMARVKFFGLFICALCRVQTVNFCRLATAFETPAKSESALRRIQRFMAESAPDSNLPACLIFKMLPHRPPYKPVMDRTGWKSGQTDINVLAPAIVYDGIAFLIPISMPGRCGNPNTGERVGIINRYVKLFGAETVDCLPADREFTGKHRMGRLNQNRIRYCIRVRENFGWKIPKTANGSKHFGRSTARIAVRAGFCSRFIGSAGNSVIFQPQKLFMTKFLNCK
jgi:hypothetical protein